MTLAGYGMVLPKGLLGPEANAVRYRARRAFPFQEQQAAPFHEERNQP